MTDTVECVYVAPEDEVARFMAEGGKKLAAALGFPKAEVVPRNVGGQRIPKSYILRVFKES